MAGVAGNPRSYPWFHCVCMESGVCIIMRYNVHELVSGEYERERERERQLLTSPQTTSGDRPA